MDHEAICPTPSNHTVRDELIGKTIAGRFTIEAALGQGGYGGVFRAMQQGVMRPVALKVLHPHLTEREIAVRRFEREAQLASRIRHPNAVTIYDFGVDGDLLFLVMEFLAGDTLKDYLYQRGALTPAETARIGYGIASALDAAHRLGLIHRDLKPSNILMTDVNGILEPVVIDFGLAKLFEHDGEGMTLTESSMMVGTPGYMSPETVRGLALDGRADLYSLGIILYELLTGAVPFRGHTPMDTATKHVLEMPAPIGSVVPTPLPPALEALVMRLLSKAPDVRPESAREVMELLEPIARLDGDPTQLLRQRDAAALIRPSANAPALASAAPTAPPAQTAGGLVGASQTRPVAPAPVPLPPGADATIAPTRGPGFTPHQVAAVAPIPPTSVEVPAPTARRNIWWVAGLGGVAAATALAFALVGPGQRGNDESGVSTETDQEAPVATAVNALETPGEGSGTPSEAIEAAGEAPEDHAMVATTTDSAPDPDTVAEVAPTPEDAPPAQERAPEPREERTSSRHTRPRRQEAEPEEHTATDEVEVSATEPIEPEVTAQTEATPVVEPAVATTGELTIRTRPLAYIAINGDDRGSCSARCTYELAPGTYNIVATNAEWSDTETVEISAGEQTSVRFTPDVR